MQEDLRMSNGFSPTPSQEGFRTPPEDLITYEQEFENDDEELDELVLGVVSGLKGGDGWNEEKLSPRNNSSNDDDDDDDDGEMIIWSRRVEGVPTDGGKGGKGDNKTGSGSLFCVRGQVIFKAKSGVSVNGVFNAIWSLRARSNWDDSVKDLQWVGDSPSGTPGSREGACGVQHVVLAGWDRPWYSPRDAVVKVVGIKLPSGALLIAEGSVADVRVPLDPDYVRCDIVTSGVLIEPLKDGGVGVSSLLQIDPNGFLAGSWMGSNPSLLKQPRRLQALSSWLKSSGGVTEGADKIAAVAHWSTRLESVPELAVFGRKSGRSGSSGKGLPPRKNRPKFSLRVPETPTLDSTFSSTRKWMESEFEGHLEPVAELELYGLYKQGSMGDVNTERPSILAREERARWDSWAKHAGMPIANARLRYVNTVRRLRGQPSLNEHAFAPPLLSPPSGTTVSADELLPRVGPAVKHGLQTPQSANKANNTTLSTSLARKEGAQDVPQVPAVSPVVATRSRSVKKAVIPAGESLEAAFERASKKEAKEVFDRLGNEQVLRMYGLFKQASSGDCQDEDPGWWNRKAQLKWSAWKEESGKSKTEAMLAYVNLVRKALGKATQEAADYEPQDVVVVVEDEESAGGVAEVESSDVAGDSEGPADAGKPTGSETASSPGGANVASAAASTPARLSVPVRPNATGRELEEVFHDVTQNDGPGLVNAGLSQGQMASLYGWFKQATRGDVSGSRPGIWDVKGRMKWDAWSTKKGHGKAKAMLSYINEIREVQGKPLLEDADFGPLPVSSSSSVSSDNDQVVAHVPARSAPAVATPPPPPPPGVGLDSPTTHLREMTLTKLDGDVPAQIQALHKEVMSLYSLVQLTYRRVQALEASVSAEKANQERVLERARGVEVWTRDQLEDHGTRLEELSRLIQNGSVGSRQRRGGDGHGRSRGGSRRLGATITGITFLVIWPALAVFLYRRASRGRR